MTGGAILMFIGFVLFVLLLMYLGFMLVDKLMAEQPINNLLKALVILLVIILFIEYGGPIIGIHLLH